MNRLFFGDNLDVLQRLGSETVDLIYLDPPFNSKASYNVIFGTKRAGPSQAQSHAFEDMWTWGPDARRAMEGVAQRDIAAGQLLDAFFKVFRESAVMAYLAIMAVRLVEMRRVLKGTGSLYLHCDPAASHYLKVLLDTILDPSAFRSEIIWKRSGAHSDTKQGKKNHGHVHDTILFYTKGKTWTWNEVFTPYNEGYTGRDYALVDDDSGRRFRRGDLTAAKGGGDTSYDWRVKKPAGEKVRWQADLEDEFLSPREGWEYRAVRPYAYRFWAYSKSNMRQFAQEGRLRHTYDGMPEYKRFLDEMKGVPLQDVWTDIQPLTAGAAERLGYSTQKPLALLKRIIATSSNPGDVVLDPFCGCGTTVEAAQELGRKWIGIDITYLAIHVIETRMKRKFGDAISGQYQLLGKPQDTESATALAARDWLEFQKWAVFTLGGVPNVKPGADRGIDGVIRYHRPGSEAAYRAIVSVKGGTNVGVDAVHKLKSVVEREGAEAGILVCLGEPTRAMRNEALSAGEIGPPKLRTPKLQIIDVARLFAEYPLKLPGTVDPPEASPTPMQARSGRGRKRIEGQTEMLLPIEGKVARDEAPSKTRPIRTVDIDVIPRGRLAK
jgi:adenine-specific DNA-methyltransferase